MHLSKYLSIALLCLLVAVAFATPKKVVMHTQPVNPPVIDASGGPDGFGYRWIDNNNEPTGPVYTWRDISTTGTAITFTSTDDGITGINVGFPFSFYGTNYSRVFVCTNGYVSFSDSVTASYTPAAMPNTAAPNGMIAAYWMDLNTATGWVKYQNFGTDTLVIAWNAPQYGMTAMNTFELILVRNGTMLVQYNTIESASLTAGTIGIENAAGGVGLQVANASAYASTGRATKFYYVAPTGAVYGYVRSATGNNPIDSVTVNVGTSTGRTNAQGYYRISVSPGTYAVTASKPNWNNFTGNVTAAGDSTSYNISMTHPVPSVNPTSLELVVTPPDSVGSTITLSNTGDGTMNWSASVMPTVAATDTTWQMLYNIPVDTATRRAVNYGVEFVNGSFLVTAYNMFYRIRLDGTVIDSFAQGGAPAANFNIRDMAYDGQYVYGGWGTTLRAFNPTTGVEVTTASINIAATGLSLPRGVAYDENNDLFYVANWTESRICKINRAGIVLQQWTMSGVGGMAWYENDPDGYKLYLHRDGAAAASVWKFNTTTGDTNVVINPIPGAVTTDICGALSIVNTIVPGTWTYVCMTQGSPDRIRVYELASAQRRWSVAPASGSIAGGSNAQITVRYFSYTGDPAAQVRANLLINAGAADQTITVPITVNVVVAAPEATAVAPREYKLYGAYPNPFNPSTTIKIAVKQYGKVQMAMYDVSGRKVADLLDRELAAGIHNVNVQAVNLPSGTYFVKMNAGNYTSTTKIVLMK